MQGNEWSADQAVRKVRGSRFFGTGSVAIDGLLGGGYRQGRLTQLYGKSNTGKSQLAMQAVLIASRSGMPSIYIDTEGAFRPERLAGIAEARGWGTEGLLERIVYLRVDSSAEQTEAVRKMSARTQTSPCRLVVIDTLTRNFSLEMPGRSNMASRQGALDTHLSEIARDAFINDRAYLLTNRVTFGPVHDIGVGGKTVEQMLDVSVRLERSGGDVVATAASGRSAIARLGSDGVV